MVSRFFQRPNTIAVRRVLSDCGGKMFFKSLEKPRTSDQAGRPDEFVKKMAQNVAPNAFGAQLLAWKKLAHQFRLLLKFSKTAQSKQSSNRRKLAQSGHTGSDGTLGSGSFFSRDGYFCPKFRKKVRTKVSGWECK
jgi:hypothetical protein